jgi:hypothetical protein
MSLEQVRIFLLYSNKKSTIDKGEMLAWQKRTTLKNMPSFSEI